MLHSFSKDHDVIVNTLIRNIIKSFYDILKQFSSNRAPIEAMAYKNNIPHSLYVTSERTLQNTYSMVSMLYYIYNT